MNSKKLVRFDWAIKTLLRNKVNFPILAGFLSELLRTDVTIESLLESESNKKGSQDKSNRVDVFAKLANGERVIIEVQCEHEWDFLSRMLYGVSKVVIEHLKEGDAYGLIPRVISVNIVYFDLGHGEDYIYHGTTQFRGIHKNDTLQLGELEKKHYPDHIDQIAHILPEYYVLKVDKFDLNVRDTLDEWIYALQQSEVRPEFQAKGIREAAHQLAVMNLSEEERHAYERHIGDVRISKSTLETSFTDGLLQGEARGLAKGLAKGLAEGRNKGLAEGALKTKKAMVHNLYRSKFPLEEIASITELSLEEVKRFIEEIL